ncbi:hypothetical protein QQ020_32940 [Fulvivirgaceae bacterium BMA12]|uniref:Uncharacterized protein n=1 Tax=Agaribacillus aureus TaxID=3051825 RepID=A0ABT8LGK2_9BACT|nr:hypothetical protein [Fulvivirgaceae bacterium BMA12]
MHGTQIIMPGIPHSFQLNGKMALVNSGTEGVGKVLTKHLAAGAAITANFSYLENEFN